MSDMNFLSRLLREKDYLPLRGRDEMKRLLETYSYGVTPAIPVSVSGKTVSRSVSPGGETMERLEITLSGEPGIFTFPAELFLPVRGADGNDKPPVILHIAFRPVPDRYIPVRLITGAGYALAVLVYTDIVNDDHFGDFSGGLAGYFGTGKDRRPDEWGKIGMWAYGASRLMDYLVSRGDLDTSRSAVIGHSRLGKTALWCGALDQRFAAVISNDSGYGGAASSKRGTGERVTDFIRAGSWDWFCPNFTDYAGEKEDEKPYDQSFLLAMIAPRLLCVGSASLDAGADPMSEFTTALHASKAWEEAGLDGLVCPDRLPSPGDRFFGGRVGYQLRPGEHSLTPDDWSAYLDFLGRYFVKK